jgi:SAM-dependent methyltransferase
MHSKDDNGWSLDNADSEYRHKLVNVPQTLADWFQPFGGIAEKEVLDFGCGEGTMALGLALQHEPKRIVGIEVQDAYLSCLPRARNKLGLNALPSSLRLERIEPGQPLAYLGSFDFVYSWSVFEHVSQDQVGTALASVASVLKRDGVFMMQISPLYYSAFGSHLGPWIPEPWAHLSMQDDAYERALFESPDAASGVEESNRGLADVRSAVLKTYHTLNKMTAPRLERAAKSAGLKIIRDYRTLNEHPIPEELGDLYNREILLTEQIVWLLQRE